MEPLEIICKSLGFNFTSVIPEMHSEKLHVKSNISLPKIDYWL
jgi:hypothetical protein